MSGLTDFRAKHPEYNDMSDPDLAAALHRKFYSDMPIDQFNAKLGLTSGEKPKADVPYRQEGIADTLFRLTPMGIAKDLYGVATDPMGSLRKADDSVRTLANGMTFGYADKLAGNMNGTGTEAERAKSTAARDRLGTTGLATEIVGSLALPLGAAKAGITAANIPGAVGKYGGLLLDGAAYGALDAAGHDRSIAEGAGMGGLLGLGGQAVGTGVEAAARVLKKVPKPTSLLDLQKAKDAKYAAVDNAGEAFTPEQMQALSSGMADDLSASGIDPVLNPMPYRFQQVIADKAKTPTTLRELDKIDSKIGRKLLTSTDGEDRYLGGLLRDNIQEFLDANGGSGLVNEARNANKRFRNTERVLGAADKAERRAASSGSGGNEDNAIRQNIRAILDNPRTAKFYSAEEKAAMEKVVRGTKGQNFARRIGKMSPENGGLMAALSTFGSMMNPLVAAPAAAGFVSKRIADRATKQNLDELIYLLSTGQKQPSRQFTPAQRRALQNAIRSGTVGLLGLAAQ